jgi:hypothetical protein
MNEEENLCEHCVLGEKPLNTFLTQDFNEEASPSPQRT